MLRSVYASVPLKWWAPGLCDLLFTTERTNARIDYWDLTVTDGLARDREVILFNNAGFSSSSGEVPTTFERMGANAITFIKALGLKQVDVLGSSIGGMVSQEITLRAPDLVRRLILESTGPRGGRGAVNFNALAPPAYAPVPRPSRPLPRKPEPRWSRRHSAH